MTIEEVKQERNQLQMGIERAIAGYNDKTGARTTAISIQYEYFSKVGELPMVNIEVKL